MDLSELKDLPMIKAHMTRIDFELNDDNISSYRETFDDQTVTLVYWEEEDSYVVIGADMCDALYMIMEETEDRDYEINNVYYVDSFEVKNYHGDRLNLLGAVVEAYAGPEDRQADEVGETVVVKLLQNDEPACFIMNEYNYWDDELTNEEFDTLWNE